MSRSRFVIIVALAVVFLTVSLISVFGQNAAVVVDEWTQDAHDAQRTGYTSEDPVAPWTPIWYWNGPDAQGGNSAQTYTAPREARTVTGGSYVYVPAGAKGLYALNKTDGRPAWNVTGANFNSTPAYDPATGYLLAGGADGKLYKIDTRTGTVAATYNAGNALNKSVLLVGSSAYVVTDNGQLHKVDTGSMTRTWMYAGNGPIATPPSYSASRDAIVYATNDLYVHAVNNNNGSLKWRIKPTPNPAGFPNEFFGQWPVIAEKHGVVFLRMRLGHPTPLYSGPGPGGMYPPSNAQTRQLLIDNPQLKNLFALSLDTGAEAFIPAVGYGGHEVDLGNGQYNLATGPVPVIKVLPDGTEVAYQMFRSGQVGDTTDGRWDSSLGEMVLDNTSIPGMVAGDLRFIQFHDSNMHISDEQTPITLAANTIMHAHWAVSESARILDRSNARGMTWTNPITTEALPSIIRTQTSCGDYNPMTHWTTCTLLLFNDSRTFNGPGWWVYWNANQLPNPRSYPDSPGFYPLYTYVSSGLMIVSGQGGELMVLKHSGSGSNPQTGTLPPTATRVPPTATRVPPTATTVPPTATLVPPTATLVPSTATLVPPTATSVPPTATLVPPTATLVPSTATLVPPTATSVPPTATLVPPTATLVMPTATPTVAAGVSPTPPFGSGNAGVLVNINPPAAAPGQEVAVELKLYNVSDLYGFQAECQVDPTVLLGTSLIGGEGFNTTNSIVVDKQYQPDGRWLVAGSRFNPGVAIQGNVTAFSLKYLVQTASTSPVICTVLGVNADGHDVPLEVVNGIFNDPNNTNFPPVLPTAVPTATALPPTAVPTAAVLSSVNGTAKIPGAPSQDGITVALASGNSILAQLVTLADGGFQFVDVPVGSYTLLLSAPHSLVSSLPVSVTADGQIINAGIITLVMGDVDKNLTIDLQDAVLIGANFGLDGSLMPDADLNRDLLINIRDLVQVGSHFGMTSPVLVPAPA